MRQRSRGIRSVGLLALLLTFAVLVPAPGGAATWPPFVPETVAHNGPEAPDDPTAPRLALDPSNGALRLAWMVGNTVWHAWRVGENWQSDTVATNLELLDWGVGPGGRLAALCVQPGGTLVVLRATTGAWQADTVLVDPGPYLGALAVDEADEPVVAAATNPAAGTVARLWFARRGSGGWTLSELDTSTRGMGRPSLALDATGRPRIACTDGDRYNRVPVVLRYFEASGPTGLFTGSAVDSGSIRDPSLALDPASGEPRVAYSRSDYALYAARTAGQWHRELLPFSGRWLSLSIAADGSATVACTAYRVFSTLHVSEPPAGCGPMIETGTIFVAQSLTSTSGAAFVLTDVIHLGSHNRNGPRSVLSLGLGHARIAGVSCSDTLQVWLASQDGKVDAPIGRLGEGIRLALAPNPLRVGEGLTVAFGLEHRAQVTLTLYDVTGRAAARRDLGEHDPGRHQETWDPPPLAGGIYWLVLRAGGDPLGHSSLVVVH